MPSVSCSVGENGFLVVLDEAIIRIDLLERLADFWAVG